MKITSGSICLLGTGASLGVPRLGCHCPVCKSTDPKWKRSRTSALVRLGDKQILIDAGPDFRRQALSNDIEKIDALLITHVHYDHVGGIDDLRALIYQNKGPIPIYGSAESIEEVKRRFHYLFIPKPDAPKELLLHPLEADEGQFSFEGIPIQYFTFYQRKMKVTGFRIGKMAYVTDIKQYELSILEHLKDLDLLVLSALSTKESVMHLTLEESIAFAQKTKAKKTLLVHLSHDVDPSEVGTYLPETIELGYDGQIALFGM